VAWGVLRHGTGPSGPGSSRPGHTIVIPPSTATVCPVMKPASSLQEPMGILQEPALTLLVPRSNPNLRARPDPAWLNRWIVGSAWASIATIAAESVLADDPIGIGRIGIPNLEIVLAAAFLIGGIAGLSGFSNVRKAAGRAFWRRPPVWIFSVLGSSGALLVLRPAGQVLDLVALLAVYASGLAIGELGATAGRRSDDGLSEDESTGDAPIRDWSQDRIGVLNLARKVEGAVESGVRGHMPSIGLYGPWGSGKTSLVNLVMRGEVVETKDRSVSAPICPARNCRGWFRRGSARGCCAPGS